jgi:hypothetical protein
MQGALALSEVPVLSEHRGGGKRFHVACILPIQEQDADD